MKLVFSKEKWLEIAAAQMAAGIITQQDIDHTCEILIDGLDGKTKDEIDIRDLELVDESCFKEVSE